MALHTRWFRHGGSGSAGGRLPVVGNRIPRTRGAHRVLPHLCGRALPFRCSLGRGRRRALWHSRPGVRVPAGEYRILIEAYSVISRGALSGHRW